MSFEVANDFDESTDMGVVFVDPIGTATFQLKDVPTTSMANR
jgi:hypothetical protein